MAPRDLYSCPKCQRHLFTHRECCPFCDQASDQRPQSRLGAGLLALGLGIGISGCEQESTEEEARADMLYDIAADFGPEAESDREPAVPPYGSPALDQDLPPFDMTLEQPAYGSPEIVDFAIADQGVADQGEADQAIRPEADREPPVPPYGSPALDRGAEE